MVGVAELTSARAPGRPRDAEVEARILQTALRHLSEYGYSRMSMDAVAAEAGASKPTLYRRWPSKADLATAALRTIQVAEPKVNSGSTVADLAGALRNFCRSLLRPNGMALIGTVLAEETHTPELLSLFRERIVASRRAMLNEILERARQRGELRPEANLDCVVNMLVGAFYAKYLATSSIPSNFPDELAETIWRGIAAKQEQKVRKALHPPRQEGAMRKHPRD
jgi:AcrR family transcriptional regulator